MNQDISFPGRWNASAFFERLISKNRLARKEGFRFCEVSGLAGLSELLALSQSATNFLAVDETSDGKTALLNNPSRKAAKSVFMAMKCAPADMKAREECFAIMHELFRQLMSALIRQRTKLLALKISIDQDVVFNEIDRYFAAGSACARFVISYETPIDLRFRQDEWINDDPQDETE